MARGESPIHKGIEEGVQYLMERFPQIRDPKYILNHLSPTALRKHEAELYHEAKHLMGSEGYTQEQAANYLVNEMAKYVASGEPLKQDAKEVILRENKKEQADAPWYRNPVRKIRAMRELESEDELDQTLNSFHRVAEEISAHGYSPETAPELYQELGKMQKTGFLYAAIRALEHEGLIKEKEARQIKYDLSSKVKERGGKVVEMFTNAARKEMIENEKNEEQIGGLEKIAASIFGIFGLGALAISGLKMNGAVIGISTTGATIIGLGGIILFVIALIILLRILKKEDKEKKNSKKLVKKKRR